jgi:hypothetical protein
MAVISRWQNVRQLPLLDRAGDNPASCRAKNTPPPDVSRVSHPSGVIFDITTSQQPGQKRKGKA